MHILTELAVTLSKIRPGDLPHAGANQQSISTILGIVFNIVGAIALLVVVVSGLRYVNSAGDPAKAKKAREGIIYALVGVTIAIIARAVVAFVGKRI